LKAEKVWEMDGKNDGIGRYNMLIQEKFFFLLSRWWGGVDVIAEVYSGVTNVGEENSGARMGRGVM
jgi:hypothetical protein